MFVCLFVWLLAQIGVVVAIKVSVLRTSLIISFKGARFFHLLFIAWHVFLHSFPSTHLPTSKAWTAGWAKHLVEKAADCGLEP